VIFLNIIVLLIGAFFLSVVYENIAGNKHFSLPILNILLVVIIGSILTIWHGWLSTGIVLGVYALICVFSGFFEKRRT
jgi:hypothetical protein